MKENPIFHDEVKMWVFEEIINGRKLTEIINQDHENTKYLPGFKIPNNVVSVQRYTARARAVHVYVAASFYVCL